MPTYGLEALIVGKLGNTQSFRCWYLIWTHGNPYRNVTWNDVTFTSIYSRSMMVNMECRIGKVISWGPCCLGVETLKDGDMVNIFWTSLNRNVTWDDVNSTMSIPAMFKSSNGRKKAFHFVCFNCYEYIFSVNSIQSSIYPMFLQDWW